MIRVLIAEDNELLRDTLQLLLDAEDDCRCAATTAVLADVEALCREHEIDVAVLDIELRGQSSLRTLPQLHASLPQVRFIIFSGHSHPEIMKSALESGASAYVVKTADTDKLLEAIRKPA